MRFAVLLTVPFFVACSAIVGGDPPSTFACQAGLEFDPCRELDPPMRCVVTEENGRGTCQPCGVEICGNGIDDDCNGVVDDVQETCNNEDDDCDGAVDESLDVDGDGFTWCRTGPTPLDCNDADDDVFPRDASENSEDCDGIDNDCSDATADGSSECDLTTESCDPVAAECVPLYCDARGDLCEATEFCDQRTVPPSCAPLDETCFRTGCDGDERCDPRTGNCVAPQPDGALCDGDAECASSLCIPGAALRAAGTLGAKAGVCGSTCCNDSDCGGEATCWASGSGARACVPNDLLGMMFGVPDRAACTTRSQCEGSNDCALDAQSGFTVENRVTMTCSAPFRTRRPCSEGCGGASCLDGFCAQSCRDLDECSTGLCVGVGTFTPGSCRETCGSAEDCPEAFLFFESPSCRFRSFRLDSTSRDDFVSYCSYSNSGNAAGGASCTSDADCRDAACLAPDGSTTGDGRTCAATCCNDDDCGGEQCRPQFLRGHWETHCRPRPSFPTGGT
ncbi:MAG: hypothetical protein AB8I08_35860 [Sandaracinaceae bacterium]